MKKIKSFLIGIAAFGLAMVTQAQINTSNVVNNLTTNKVQQTAFDNALAAFGGLTFTNISVDPYATYAPNAPHGDSKFGGGLFAAYNFNQFAGAGIGLDWLGQFSLVSANFQFQTPFHLSTVLPAAGKLSFLQNVVISPFALVGLGTPYSGNGHFNGSPMAITDLGGYLAFGHLWGGQFNTGVAWGKWVGQGPYGNVVRYHAFFGYMKSF